MEPEEMCIRDRVGKAALGEGAQQVERGSRLLVCRHQSGRVRAPGLLVERLVVHHVAAERGEIDVSDALRGLSLIHIFLLARPLLEAIRSTEPVVLLIDEVDRVELETEALLLEILSEYQVSIPELGTVRALSLIHI